MPISFLVAELLHFKQNRTESVHFLVLMNSATKQSLSAALSGSSQSLPGGPGVDQERSNPSDHALVRFSQSLPKGFLRLGLSWEISRSRIAESESRVILARSVFLFWLREASLFGSHSLDYVNNEF